MTHDGTIDPHIHTSDGDIIYLQDNFSTKENRVLTKAEFLNKMSKGSLV